MKSKTHGKNSSSVEVTHVSSHGIWLLAGEQEFFLSYVEFPWFKDATIGKILNVEQPSIGHFYWPDLDVDLGMESIERPEEYPLISKR